MASPRTTDGCISQPTRVSELARPLRDCICRKKGKQRGLGSIAQGNLDDEVLEYLQKCPSWEQWHAECRRNQFKQNHGISHEEGSLGMKSEKVGYIDATNPPQRMSLHGNAGLSLIQSERLACFVKALRRGAKTWLQELAVRVRAEMARHGLPS